MVEDLVSLIDIYPTLMDMAQHGSSGLARRPFTDAAHERAAVGSAGLGHEPVSQQHDQHRHLHAQTRAPGNTSPTRVIHHSSSTSRMTQQEMTNLATKREDVAREMDAKLRKIVDYPAVDTKAKAYDKASFRKWRADMSDEALHDAMDRDLQDGRLETRKRPATERLAQCS